MRVSITKKIIIYSLLLGLSATSVIGIYTYIRIKDALLARTFDQLVSIRNEKTKRLESFFKERSNDLHNLINYKKIGELLYLIDSGTSVLKQNEKSRFDSNYIYYLVSSLRANKFYKKLLFYYPNHKSYKLDLEGDSLETTNIVAFEPDYFKNLSKNHCLTANPFIYEIIKQDEKGSTNLIIGEETLLKNGEKVKVVLEISTESINKIMFENNPSNGLGKTGEAYLVGNDLLMRSSSRFKKNSVYNTIVNTKSVQLALNDSVGIEIIKDYRNVSVLSSFGKVKIGNLDWVIVSEIDYEEAMVPITQIRNNILYLLIIVGLFLMGVIAVVSNMITAPIRKLRMATDEIAGGEYGKTLNLETNDEIGDLIKAFNQMTLRLKYQAEKLEEQKLTRLQSLIDGQELERQRLSRELHDGLAQLILAIKMRTERALSTNAEISQQIMVEMRTLLAQALNEIRNISNDLMPAVLNEFGLKQGIAKLVNEVEKIHSIELKFLCKDDLKISDKRIETYAYRIIQEAFNNIIKHANAKSVELKIEIRNNALIIDIYDDGMGFDTKNKSLCLGNGISNMKERVSLLGGIFEMRSKQGIGTNVHAQIPI